MSKTVNKVQLDLLLGFMQAHPSLAQNVVKENKGKLEAFWKKTEKELNNAGPPVKSIAEWKKVWMDKKRYVRKKTTKNKEARLSSVEESIHQLTSRKSTEENVENERHFEFLEQLVKKENAETHFSYSAEDSINEIEEYISLPDVPVENDQSTLWSSKENQKRIRNPSLIGSLPEENRSRQSRQITTIELVQEELETQKQLCEKIGNAIEAFSEQNLGIQTNLKKIYRSFNRFYKNQKFQLKEMKRHNHEMEKFRKAEIDSTLERNRLARMKLHLLQNQKNG